MVDNPVENFSPLPPNRQTDELPDTRIGNPPATPSPAGGYEPGGCDRARIALRPCPQTGGDEDDDDTVAEAPVPMESLVRGGGR